MTDDADDFFEDAPAPDGPPRDRYGRPMLFPRGADQTNEKNRKPYTRASSLSDYLADFSHIWKWKMRYLARSLGQNRDLAMLAGAECYTTGFDQGDLGENRASGRRLDEIVERALERGKISERADYGTAFHALTEPRNDGYVEDFHLERDVESYKALVDRLGAVILGTEMFTANDDLMVAGTFDNLMWVPGFGIIITDKKTSREVHGADFRIQLADYANSDLYDWETDQRQTLEEYVASIGWDPALINRKEGLIFWTASTTGKTEPVRLDLVAGLEAAHHAVWVRDKHKKGKHSWPAEAEILESLERGRAILLDGIQKAKSEATLNYLWNTLDVQAIWTDEHTAAAVKRKAELT
jgi:hypothetical protein